MTPWTAARQASLSFTISWSLLKLIRRWCHPTISSFVSPFSSCSQPFPYTMLYINYIFNLKRGMGGGERTWLALMLVRNHESSCWYIKQGVWKISNSPKFKAATGGRVAANLCSMSCILRGAHVCKYILFCKRIYSTLEKIQTVFRNQASHQWCWLTEHSWKFTSSACPEN